jgi:phosphate transport system ATP-binding protein
MAWKLVVDHLQAWYYSRLVLKEINLAIKENHITAVIGPSGCGKSTFIRCLNRMHETVPGARVAGRVLLDEQEIYALDDPVGIRRKIGMVFQRPNIFPAMTIYQNVAVGLLLNGKHARQEVRGRVEESLRRVGLWEEVAGRLHQSATGLSGGQLQRLCIARALAVEPEVVLMDEPCSNLDPVATVLIEELLRELKAFYTIVIVTHNMQQAARVSDYTAFLMQGELIEYAATPDLFIGPRDRRTEDYLTGRYGNIYRHGAFP